MPRKGITEEQVATAMAALEVEGLTPSVRLIRDRLGSGSHGTISAVMAAVRAKGKTTATVSPAVPEELTEHIQMLLASIWAASNKVASAENLALRQQIHEQVYCIANVHEDFRQAMSEMEKRIVSLQIIGDGDFSLPEKISTDPGQSNE